MCSCVLKPQAMKLCVCVRISLCVCVCMRLFVCVCVCKGGECVGECGRQTCQFHSWFLWLQGSDQSRVTLSITALWNRAWGEHTIIYWRQTHTHTHTWLAALTHKTKRAVKHTTWVSHHIMSKIFFFFPFWLDGGVNNITEQIAWQ